MAARTAAYKQLVEEFGAGPVADRLLEKWLNDPDAEAKWERLAAAVQVGRPPAPARARPFKYWVVLWYFSMGWRGPEVAEQLGLSPNTIRREMKYARQRLNMVGAPLPGVVARAMRLGIIP